MKLKLQFLICIFIILGVFSATAQHSFSYNVLNTFEYRYTFENENSVFSGTRLIGLEFNVMLVDSRKDFDFENVSTGLPFEILDFWVGYGQRYGDHRLDYMLSFTATQFYDYMFNGDYQEQELHDPIYTYTSNARNLLGH